MQAELGDIVYVELPEVGSEVKKGEQFGVIESVKVGCLLFSSTHSFWSSLLISALHKSHQTCNPVQAASDVNSPVSGEVSAVNDALTDESSKVRVKSPCFGLFKLHSWSSVHRWNFSKVLIFGCS